jgi:hypothetical protein
VEPRGGSVDAVDSDASCFDMSRDDRLLIVDESALAENDDAVVIDEEGGDAMDGVEASALPGKECKRKEFEK